MKRILSLDGGGVRGALTLGYLAKIESELRQKNGPDYRLYQYYDLIGGTSTGSFIAAALVIGKEVEEIKQLYFNLSKDVFPAKNAVVKTIRQLFKGAAYDHRPLEKHLRNEFGNIKMFDDELKTHFCSITKRLDTNSTWVLHNHPDAKYRKYNNFLLRDILRATSAAPTYFLPTMMDVGRGEIGTFVDGGLSMSNNPSLQLFLLATVKGYKFNWPIGPDKLQITSFGTGTTNAKGDYAKMAKYKLTDWAKSIPDYLMKDALSWNSLLMQYLSDSPTAEQIDREVGDLEGEILINAFTYYRYNTTLDYNTLSQLDLDIDINDKFLAELADMSNANNVQILYEIGSRMADKQIQSGRY